MNTLTRVSAFGAGLVVAFGAALGTGTLIGPIGPSGPVKAAGPHSDMATDDHGAGATSADTKVPDAHASDGHGATSLTAPSAAPAGLSATDQGYRLAPGATTVAPSKHARVTFSVLGPDGRAVTGFTTAHEKQLHLIVVRRDLSGFQHVHPTMAADGTWSVGLDLSRPGQWRMFADFDPDGDTEGLVLGTDLAVPGSYLPVPVPGPTASTVVDGYTVHLEGSLHSTRTRPLDLTVTRGANRVELEPYLGADGHLVVLREGDLAYAHAHPAHGSTMGRDALGEVGFQVEAPGPGRYRMFLDFKAGGTVHTAAFTADAGSTP